MERKLNDILQMGSDFAMSKIRAFHEMENQVIEESLFNTVVPPIKGEITKGKIKWRGLKLIYRKENDGSYSVWLEQRGKVVSKTANSNGK